MSRFYSLLKTKPVIKAMMEFFPSGQAGGEIWTYGSGFLGFFSPTKAMGLVYLPTTVLREF